MTLNWILLDPSYKKSIQHWLWGAGKNNFLQNLNVYLNENVFDDLIFIYRMKIHFGKDILSLIVWKFWKTKLDRMFTDTPSNDLNVSKIVIFATDFLTEWKCIGTQQFSTLFHNKNASLGDERQACILLGAWQAGTPERISWQPKWHDGRSLEHLQVQLPV